METGELDAWLDDLALLAGALENQEFCDFLDAPQIPVGRKVEAIKRTFGDSIGRLPLNLASLLASRNVAHITPAIVDQFQRVLDAHLGIERAEVVSAVALSDKQQQRIEELLQRIVGKEIRMTSRVDPQILGGLVARVGDRVIDGSTSTKLHAMRRELVERMS